MADIAAETFRRLADWLERNNVSQNRFAKHIDMQQPRLNRYLRGKYKGAVTSKTIDTVNEGMATYFD